MKARLLFPLAAAAAALALSGCHHGFYGPRPLGGLGIVYVQTAPPPPRFVPRPPPPSSTAIWIDGYWNWTGVTFVWVDGYWERNPPPGRTWEPGGWVQGPQGWHRQPGRWVESRGRR